MGRIARSCFTANYHHVMTQGIGKSFIFKEEVNKVKMMNIMSETVEKEAVKIVAYCIMDNHLHLLLNTPDVFSMSHFMKVVNIRYARYYNKMHNRVGYVFRDRYKSQPIENENYLLRCIRYIHNNPLKAGMTEELTAYKWSSYGEILSNNPSLVDMTQIYDLFAMDSKRDLYAFCEFHNKAYLDDGFIFLEDDEVVSQDLDDGEKLNFLFQKEQGLSDLQGNSQQLSEYVIYLRDELKMSQRQISEWIGIGRETLRKLMLSISPSP